MYQRGFGNTWPEQQEVERWWNNHRQELKEAVTEPRLRLQQELEQAQNERDEWESKEAGCRKALDLQYQHIVEGEKDNQRLREALRKANEAIAEARDILHEADAQAGAALEEADDNQGT